jgi:glucose repression regulatory protein TUP1
VFAVSTPHRPPIYLTSVESQVSELGTVRRSLFDLEAQHERAHNYYEDEIKRIRSELLATRQSGAVPVSLGIPGRSPRQLGALPVPLPNTPAMTEAQSSSQLLRHRALERDVPERESRGRTRDGVEHDLDHHVADQHDVKRQKTRRNYTGSYFMTSLQMLLHI